MAGFKALRDVSTNFEEDLRHLSNELFTAKVEEPFEDVISKKLQDLSVYTSKLRLLRAKSLAATSEPTTQTEEEAIINYEDAVKWKIVEQQVVKYTTQSHHVKALLTAPDSSLSPDMLERKKRIYEQMMKFKDKEMQLRELDAVMKERLQQLEGARRELDSQLGLLRQRREDMSGVDHEDQNSALANKLRVLEGKVNLIRGLIARLATARGGSYDWLADPDRRLRALKLARQQQ